MLARRVRLELKFVLSVNMRSIFLVVAAAGIGVAKPAVELKELSAQILLHVWGVQGLLALLMVRAAAQRTSV